MAAAGTESDQKRQRIYAACESCRKKKSKCLGGQPCKACISSARSSLASSSKRPSESDPEVIAKAQELCIIDLNRKQRGPKAKSEKKTIESSSEVKKEVENEKRSKEVKRRKLNDEEASLSVGPSSTQSKEVSSAAHSSNEYGRSPSMNDSNSQFQDPYSFSSFKWPVHSQDQQSPAASHSSSELRTPSLTSASSLARNSSFDEVGGTFTHGNRTDSFPSQDFQQMSQFPTPSSTSSLSPPASHARHALHSLMTSRSTSQFNDKNLSPFPPNLHSPQLPPPPPSLSNVGRFNFSNPSFSWPQTPSTLAPQQNLSNQSDQAARSGRRESVSTELLRKLSQFYTDQDRPYIALALGQFSEFDAATKLIPSRCLFGEENNPTALADTPAHLQLALLSLLAHRSLLLPESQSSRDLKSAWAEEAPPKLTRNSPLSGEMRENMLLFGRRSWNLSHNLLLSALSEGVVEPSLLQTGYILDMSASEDGIGTKTMGQFKAWLFHIVKAWHLNLIDSHPSFPIDLTSSPSTLSSFSSSPSSSPNVRHLHVPPQSSPEPRKADARYLVSDPIDREALRRVIFVICSSYSWTHSNDHNQPTSFHLGIQHFQVNSPSSDDEIHIGSRWKAERTWKENNLLSLVQRSQRLWNRANLLLHTPLEDLLLNRGPEIDLQNAIQQLEDESEAINHLVTVPKIGQDPAIKIQAFLESRLAKLILNRLFSTLSLYSDLRFALPTTVQSKGNLRASEHLVPQGQANASIFETLSGVSPTEGPVRKLIEDGADPNSLLHFYTNTLPPQSSYRLDPVRPSFSKNPRIEALQSVIEIGWLVTAGYEKLEAAHQEEEPLEGEVGTAAGLSISSDCRALRWPRHLRLFSQHAFAMSSEVRVAGWSWIGLSNAASAPNNQQLASIRNYRNENHLPNFDIYQSSVDLWETGEKLIRLLKALGKSGSAHSSQTAALAEKYRDERARWIESQLGNQANR